MKYTIISIDDSRRSYKENIRKRVRLDEISIPATNGREVDLSVELEKRGLRVPIDYLTAGEVGVWLSVFDCWQWAVDNQEELLVFEDDAIPAEGFQNLFNMYHSELPEDYGFLSLWIPDNQVFDYLYDVVYDEHGVPDHVGPNKIAFLSNYNFGAIRLARVYQGYGNVAMLYSPKGAQELIDAVRRTGLNDPVDCYIFCRAHTGITSGYAPKPVWARAVKYDWQAETTIHDTERVIF